MKECINLAKHTLQLYIKFIIIIFLILGCFKLIRKSYKNLLATITCILYNDLMINELYIICI